MSTPTQKPMGPYDAVYVKEESTAFTFEAFAATDVLRATAITMGDVTRARDEIEETRKDRGSYAEVLGGLQPVDWSIEARWKGSGTAGTAVPARKALMAAGAGLSETVVGSTSVTYESDEADPATTVSIYRVSRGGRFGEYLIGAIVKQIQYTFNLTDAPKILWSGSAARKWEFMASSVADVGGISDVDTTLTLAEDCIRTGDETDTVTGLEIYVAIEDEIVCITAFTHSTKSATITRGAFSTTPAAHAQNKECTAYAAAGTYGESGVNVSPNNVTLTDGVGTIDITEFSYTLETGRDFDPMEFGNIAVSALYNGYYKGTGTASMILASNRYYLQRNLDAGSESDLVLTCGDTAGSILTLNLDHVRWVDGVPKDLGLEPTVVALNFRTRDAIDVFAGQLQHVET